MLLIDVPLELPDLLLGLIVFVRKVVVQIELDPAVLLQSRHEAVVEAEWRPFVKCVLSFHDWGLQRQA